MLINLLKGGWPFRARTAPGRLAPDPPAEPSPADARLRQQAAIAYLARRALRAGSAASVLAEACRVAARVLDADQSHLLELLPDGRTLMARAASGWPPGRLAHWQMDVPPDSRLGQALRAGGVFLPSRSPAIEARAAGGDLLDAIHAQDGIAVVVGDAGTSRGIFGVYSAQGRRFSRDQIQCMRALARVVETALDREVEASALRHARRSAGAGQADLLRLVVNRLRPALRDSVGHLWSFRQGPSDSFSFRRAVRETERQVAGVADFIEDLSLLADLLDGRAPERRLVTLGPLLASLCDQLSPRAESSGVTLQVAEAGGQRAVAGDPVLVRRALFNVLDNALRATGPGGTIVLSCSSEPGWMVVEVADTGCGMTPGHVDRLNAAGDGGEPADTGRPRLGWRLTHAIVEAHDGEVSAASDGPGKGSRITLRFPEAVAEPCTEIVGQP